MPPTEAPAYEVVVLPANEKITDTTVLFESQAIPLCNTRALTAPTTETQTATTTGTVAPASSRSNASTGVITLSVATCAGPTLNGSLGLGKSFTGQVALGLFFLAPDSVPLTHRFIDSGFRATASFQDATSASFSFSSIPGGEAAYEVVILPSQGTITATTVLIESQAMPPCGARTSTSTTVTHTGP